jgi:hypothetical protein
MNAKGRVITALGQLATRQTKMQIPDFGESMKTDEA